MYAERKGVLGYVHRGRGIPESIFDSTVSNRIKIILYESFCRVTTIPQDRMFGYDTCDILWRAES